MGMYTELFFRGELKEVDGPLTEWFAQYADPKRENPEPFDDHPFFSTERWTSVIWGGGAVYHMTRGLKFERGSKAYGDFPRVYIHSSLKHYGSEIHSFLDWIRPHIRACEGDFLGYYLYEDSRPSEMAMTWGGRDVDESVDLDREQPSLIFYSETGPMVGEVQ